MSVFCSLVTETVPLPPPADPGTTVTIRKLAPKHLEAARRAAQTRATAEARDLGLSALLKEIQALPAGTVERAVAANPLLLYDAVTILQHGLVNWTLERDCHAVEVLEDLDEGIRDHLATVILKLTRPGLFQTAEEGQAARKND